MVEYSSTIDFDNIFQALSDSTRRDILSRILVSEQRITDLASHYAMSFAGVAKHLDVLAKARLIGKRRQGREQVIYANPETIAQTAQLLQQYEAIWTQRFQRLDQLLEVSKITKEHRHD